jgi:dolichol-phosphate mannosyltransferase
METAVRPEIEISVAIPVFNEQAVLPELYRRLKSVLVDLRLSHEIVFVNDGSRDNSWNVILSLANRDPNVKAVGLSRNFGHQIAITAAIDCCHGATVVVMDADLQDPPELIPVMYEQFRSGYDVVYGQRRTRDGESLWKRATAKAFYRLIHRMTSLDIPLDTGDFRLMSRRVVDDLRSFQERSRFIRGLVTWVGYNQTPVLYDRDRRFAGETKFSTAAMVKFAIDGITSFSSRPLRLASHLGLFFAALSMAAMLGLIGYKLLGGSGLVQGWTSLIVVVLFLGGLNLVAIGVVGEYIGRIYEQVQGRPMYLVKDRVNLASAARFEVTDIAMHGRVGTSRGVPQI